MKENKILISILVPTYNRVKYLEECLDSIIEQEWFDLKELELIVTDNSEWDETKILMEKYINKHKDRNIIYNKNKKNIWESGNYNKLLDLSKWEYFIILSDDDKFYDKNSLNYLYNWILWEDDICLCRWIIVYPNVHNKIDAATIFLKNEDSLILTFKENVIKNLFMFWGILYKKRKVYYEDKSWWSRDYHFNWRYLHDFGNWKIINKKCFVYRDRKSIFKDRFIHHFILSKWHRRILNDFPDINMITKIFLRLRYYITFLLSSMFWENFIKMANFLKKIYTHFC